MKTRPINDTDDRLIIARLRLDDEDAFRDLYQKYADRIFYFSIRYLKTREDAEGVTQEIFMKIWENRKTLNPELSINSYVFTVARNNIFNRNRKKVHEKAYLNHLKEYLDERYDKTENDILLNEVKNCIDQAMRQLPLKRRKVFRLSRFECLSYPEISKRLNISERTVETHMRLALKSVRAFIDKHLGLIIPVIPFIFLLMDHMISKSAL